MIGVPGLVELCERLLEKARQAHGLSVGLGEYPSHRHGLFVSLTAHAIKVVEELLEQIIEEAKLERKTLEQRAAKRGFDTVKSMLENDFWRRLSVQEEESASASLPAPQVRSPESLSREYSVPTIDLRELEIEPEIIRLIPREITTKHGVIPVNRTESTLVVAMHDPSNIFAIDDIKFLTGYNVEVVVASEADIAWAVEKYYSQQPHEDLFLGNRDIDLYEDVDVFVRAIDNLRELGLVGSAMRWDTDMAKRLVDMILLDAVRKNAHSIQLTTVDDEDEMGIHLYIDEGWHHVMHPPADHLDLMLANLRERCEIGEEESEGLFYMAGLRKLLKNPTFRVRFREDLMERGMNIHVEKRTSFKTRGHSRSPHQTTDLAGRDCRDRRSGLSTKTPNGVFSNSQTQNPANYSRISRKGPGPSSL